MMINDIAICGYGSPEADLSASELRAIIEQALENIAAGSKVLAIIPDKTRDDNTNLLFSLAAEILASKGVKVFDAIIAQGTHTAMNAAEKKAKIGIGDGDTIPGLGKVFDHKWDCPEELVTIGELSAEKTSELTGGLLEKSVPLTINKLLAAGNYNVVLQFGATMPHEVAGFAGGAKYFFPGVAGAELTHATHWLGALATVEKIIGRVETPTRHLIEAAADFVPAQIISLTSVVSRNRDNRLQTHALFAGDFRLAVRRAAAVSHHIHIKYTHRKYKRVVALLDEHYEELWLGGKASYRLGAIIEDGGELIIYAPHLRCISDTHGEMIERYGYAPLETVRELVAQSGELQRNLCVAAHLAQVAYAGMRDENGKVVPRYHITLASQIDTEICRRVNLGFTDYHKFRREDYENDSDTLIVERAGRDLYLVESESEISVKIMTNTTEKTTNFKHSQLANWHDIPVETLDNGALRQLFTGENLMMCRLIFPPNLETTAHDHPHEQMTIVQRGKVRFIIGDKEIIADAGDILRFPPNCWHGATMLDEEVELIDIFTPIRQDFLK